MQRVHCLAGSVILGTAPPVILLPTIADGAMGMVVACVLVWNSPAKKHRDAA